MNDKKDQIYRQNTFVSDTQNSSKLKGSFKFDARVAQVFSDMISRSVPGYQQILEMLPTLVKQCHQKDCHYYDLGCSLGAGMASIAQALSDVNTSTESSKIIGIDNSAAMIQQARLTLDQLSDHSFEFHQQDIQDSAISNAAMVLMNFTLQFIPPLERNSLIQKIYDGLVPGGFLVLSEKIKFEHTKTHDLFTKIHHQYKADQGYSQLEIAKKRDAIENVLIPETLEAHTQRLTNAGFSVISPWVQNLQFISILTVK